MNNKKQQVCVISLTILLMTSVLSGCRKAPASDKITDVSSSILSSTRISSSTSIQNPNSGQVTPPADHTENPLIMTDKESIKHELRKVITAMRQPPVMDISAAGLGSDPAMDIKNIYYQLVFESPGLKYAYDLSAAATDGMLTCSISYMPYMTGIFPEGFKGKNISTLKDLISVARSNLGSQYVDIHITNTLLEPDIMNRALQQAGGGYVNCTLNRDATQIVFSTPNGMTMDECMSALNEADTLADKVIADILTDGMTEYEKAAALYSYITKTVKYDNRYNTNKASMPYESQTALGALRDGIAICGGYSHSVKLLFEKANITCYNVTGKYYREYHMWNIALLNGQWLYFDATSDRGSSIQTGFRYFAMNGLDTQKYSWDTGSVDPLLK